jgi:shikimate kinase
MASSESDESTQYATVTTRGGDSDRHIVLIGMMGVGKTTVGRLLADRLGRRFWDNDQALTQSTGKTAAQVQQADGQAALHRLENQLLRSALQTDVPTVFAAAGSVVLEPDLVSGSIAIWLRANTDTEEHNLDLSGQHHRPLPASPDSYLRRLAEERLPMYARMADLTVDVGAGAEATCERILEALNRSVASS